MPSVQDSRDRESLSIFKNKFSSTKIQNGVFSFGNLNLFYQQTDLISSEKANQRSCLNQKLFKKYNADNGEIELPKYSSFKDRNFEETEFSLLDLIKDQTIATYIDRVRLKTSQ